MGGPDTRQVLRKCQPCPSAPHPVPPLLGHLQGQSSPSASKQRLGDLGDGLVETLDPPLVGLLVPQHPNHSLPGCLCPCYALDLRCPSRPPAWDTSWILHNQPKLSCPGSPPQSWALTSGHGASGPIALPPRAVLRGAHRCAPAQGAVPAGKGASPPEQRRQHLLVAWLPAAATPRASSQGGSPATLWMWNRGSDRRTASGHQGQDLSPAGGR